MVDSTSLVLHRGARVVTREELDAVPVPQATATWFPLGHGHVLDKTVSTLMEAGFMPHRLQLGLSSDGAKFFGTIDLQSAMMPGVSLAIGVRNSIDKSLPIAFAAGSRVFVCDNLAFRSEVTVSRKHTRFGADRFAEAMALAVGGLGQFQEQESKRIGHFQATPIGNQLAESLILRAYETEVVGERQLAKVLSHWRKPPFEEFAAPTLWSLENAFTWALADLAKSSPQRFCRQTIAMQYLLSEAAAPQFANAV
jgi:hypothetical protein